MRPLRSVQKNQLLERVALTTEERHSIEFFPHAFGHLDLVHLILCLAGLEAKAIRMVYHLFGVVWVDGVEDVEEVFPFRKLALR